MACSVSGCRQIFRQKQWEEHMRRCASSHAVETKGEVQRLKQMTYTQVIIRLLMNGRKHNYVKTIVRNFQLLKGLLMAVKKEK